MTKCVERSSGSLISIFGALHKIIFHFHGINQNFSQQNRKLFYEIHHANCDAWGHSQNWRRTVPKNIFDECTQHTSLCRWTRCRMARWVCEFVLLAIISRPTRFFWLDLITKWIYILILARRKWIVLGPFGSEHTFICMLIFGDVCSAAILIFALWIAFDCATVLTQRDF